MSARPDLHRIPRRPHAWIYGVLLSQVAVAALWWMVGWRLGLPLMLASHASVLWGVLRPSSALYGPVLTHLPVLDKRVWLTIDDGPSAETSALLDLLDAHGAKATFFLVGTRAEARPDLVHAIA
ncbi:MAG: polysaccharide deacetylase family protein, partial [Luteimonas sp.]